MTDRVPKTQLGVLMEGRWLRHVPKALLFAGYLVVGFYVFTALFIGILTWAKL